jgi:hypothetical protein
LHSGPLVFAMTAVMLRKNRLKKNLGLKTIQMIYNKKHNEKKRIFQVIVFISLKILKYKADCRKMIQISTAFQDLKVQ